MKERPIIFSSPMVKAILEGTKTQTRRPIKPQPSIRTHELRKGITGFWVPFAEDGFKLGGNGWYCPYGRPGDRLWVRETWAVCILLDSEQPNQFRHWDVWYKSDNGFQRFEPAELPSPEADHGRWRSPRFMPRWASRILLEITNVRVERLQEISEDDTWAEGITIPERVKKAADMMTSEYDDIGWCSIDGFAEGWDLFYAKKDFGWEANPWVWVIEFNMIESQPTLRLEKE